MTRLSFLSRVAFICNICFLLTWLMRYFPLPSGQIESTIIILGLVVSFIMNAVVNIFLVIVLIRRRFPQQEVPLWLAVVNAVFLLPQFYLILNDT